MDIVTKAGTIIMVAKQLDDLMREAWVEWDVETNELKDDENARFNFLTKKLQPYSKNITKTLNLLTKKKAEK